MQANDRCGWCIRVIIECERIALRILPLRQECFLKYARIVRDDEMIHVLTSVRIGNGESVGRITGHASVGKVINICAIEETFSASAKRDQVIALWILRYERQPGEIPFFSNTENIRVVAGSKLPLLESKQERDSRPESRLIAQRLVMQPQRKVGLGHAPNRHPMACSVHRARLIVVIVDID